MSEVMNVKLTPETLRETEWHLAVDNVENSDEFTEVWVSKQLPFVILARMEGGEYFIYDHLRYNKNIPQHMHHFFMKWNLDNGFELVQ